MISKYYQRAPFEVAIFKISWGSMPRDVISKYYQRAPFEVAIFKNCLGEHVKRCDL